MTMYRGMATTMEQADSMQRDALISALKKELYDLQDREHEYLSLNDEINNVETKYSMLKEEKERIQNEHRIKTDINRKNIGELRTEIDALKIQIHKCSVQIEDILREAAGVKRVCQNRDNQISSLMAANQELEAKNEQINEQNKAKVNRIKALKDQRNKCDSQNQRLHRTLEDSINALKNLEKEARMLESSNTKLANILTMAERDYTDLIEEMKSRDIMVNSTSKKLDQLNKQIEDLREKSNKLEKECMKNQQDLRNTTQQLDLAIAKNKEQTKRLKQLENHLRGVQNELDRAILERDAVENQHAALSSQHNILNTQIDSILLQIIEYEKINKQLQREVEHYMQCDEEARNMLNRKDAMRGLLQTVSARLKQTGEPIAHLR